MNDIIKKCYVASWNNAYSIGHEKIDKEHQKLFDIAQNLQRCKSENELIKIIKELIKYTKFHFRNEENFMKEIGYKNLSYHKALHGKLISALNKIVKNFNQQSMDESILQVSKLVNENILQHILIEDKKVHHELNSREDMIKKFRWKIDYKLENELLDEEHEKLFIIAQKALNYHNTDIVKHVKLTINELYEYMKEHFEHEEKFMKEINYPDYEEHKKIHDRIIQQMNDFIKKISEIKLIEFEKKLIEYMDIWLINHILYEDRKIMRFLND